MKIKAKNSFVDISMRKSNAHEAANEDKTLVGVCHSVTKKWKKKARNVKKFDYPNDSQSCI